LSLELIIFLQILQSEMDRRSWPWKKKSSDKAAVEKAAAASNTAGAANQADQVNSLISVLLLMETVLF